MITEASPILNLLLAKGVGTKTLSEIVDSLVSHSLSPQEVGIDVLANELHWREELKANALAVQEQADELAEQLERQNVQILVRGFDPYPKKLARALGKDAPPVLFAKGNLSILNAKAVGFCGSRHASDKGIHVAAESARLLGAKGVAVISGYAKGVDLAAHCAALEAGGTTTIVLAEGILHFRPKREIKSLFDEENFLVVSEYSPRLPWAAHNAMHRNNTIIGLSDAMIVIESGTTGGTHACAESVLRLGHPLFVAEYAVPAESAGGNQQFLNRGALALRGDRQGRPNLTRVYEALGIQTADTTSAADNGRAVQSAVPQPDPSQCVSKSIVDQHPVTEPNERPVDHRAYPKRLIEVDLPIARISAHARREKSIRHGHISTLHIWWARRPLAACRAVICAALWPDPADPLCPPAFREAAVRILTGFAKRIFPDRITEESQPLKETAKESLGRWEALAAGTLTLDPNEPADMPILRFCLLDFIADFANWDNSTVPAYLEAARRLTGVAHAALNDAGYELPPLECGGSTPLSIAAEPLSLESSGMRKPNRRTRTDNQKKSGSVAIQSSVKPEHSKDWFAALDAQLSTLPRPLVVDPFCGGGSIPLEALRVGADAFASDLNPVPVLLNKVVLEYIPKYGQRLAEDVRKWGVWIKREAEQELAEFYPKDPDGATPIAYLWARTIRCEGPACGAEVPLIRSLWLAKKANRSVALRLIPNPQEKRVDFDILVKQRDGWVSQSDLKSDAPDNTRSDNRRAVGRQPPDDPQTTQAVRELTPAGSPIKNPSFDGTVKRGSATCPCCGYTTPVESVRSQLVGRQGGSTDGRIFAVLTRRGTDEFRTAIPEDSMAIERARHALNAKGLNPSTGLSFVPDERICLDEIRRISLPIYGMQTWGNLFATRQLLALGCLSNAVSRIPPDAFGEEADGIGAGVVTLLAFTVDKCADYWNSIATWMPRGTVGHSLGRQAIPMTWDSVEVNPFVEFHCSWDHALDWICAFCDHESASQLAVGQVVQASATDPVLPTDSADMLATDPPYYDAVPYAHLSDFFCVWLKRSLADKFPGLDGDGLSPKVQQIVVDRPHTLSSSDHNIAYYENALTSAYKQSRDTLKPSGIAVVVFASKTTASWEACLSSLVSAGWIITASWPVDTEREARLAAMGQARLASSVHLICRPREDASGAVTETIGEWRDVLGELPKRIHEWMPRLAAEGVVGADAIFACLGPALEIFSRYSRVEKANGETATLREYLEFVWAAVSTEALSLIFQDADAAGLEPDARLTAMWLWTIGGNAERGVRSAESESEDETGEDDEDEPRSALRIPNSAFTLEYDAARKIAQGLGVHLEQCQSLIEIKGDKARLLPVAERTQYLFGKDSQAASSGGGRKKKIKQKTLFAELDEAEAAEDGWTDLKGPPPGSTVLDRVHQTMILFAANRGELLKRFLVEHGIGKDARFWKLADNLNKLYPPGTEERRWIEGVLARKKGLGM